MKLHNVCNCSSKVLLRSKESENAHHSFWFSQISRILLPKAEQVEIQTYLTSKISDIICLYCSNFIRCQQQHT
uniref:Putative ovule protein n=1 Tax=Solanum chacoense TaxID=4108 RepID=A0A0V0GWS0_SOLCH